MKIVNRKKFIKSIFITTFIIIVALICLGNILNKENITQKEITYYVSKGETLWNIAQKYKLEDQDIREYIYEVKKINNMETATIYEGQELTLIVYEEVK